jgi:hypothetical protein
MHMVKHIVFRFIAGFILLAAIAGIAFFAYQAGVVHGVGANIQVPTTGTTSAPYPLYGMPFGYYWWFPGFGIFSCLFPIFLFFLAFGVMRVLIWGPRIGWRRMHHGTMENRPWGKDVPSMFDEWHRRAHASDQGEQPADKKPEK